MNTLRACVIKTGLSDWSGDKDLASIQILRAAAVVISGFVMFLSTQNKRDPLRFLWARFLRIALMYWLATAAMISLLVSQGLPPSMTHVLLSASFIPFGDLAGNMHRILGVGLTLSYEMFFYVAFAATLWLGPPKQLLALALFFLLLVPCGSCIYQNWPSRHSGLKSIAL